LSYPTDNRETVKMLLPPTYSRGSEFLMKYEIIVCETVLLELYSELLAVILFALKL